MKRKLLAELPDFMRLRVDRIVDLPCHANSEGLQKMLRHGQDILAMGHERAAEAAVDRFMERLSQNREAPLVCYGEAETIAALHMGAVETLLISEAHRNKRQAWNEKAIASGASVMDVCPTNASCAEFCEGFGVGACLRYPMNPAILEEDEGEVSNLHDSCAAVEEVSPTKQADLECDSNSTAPSEADGVFHKWLLEALAHSLQDIAAAEALAIGTELVLCDDALEIEERIENALQMLRDEGVHEDVLMELSVHAADHF